MTSPYDTIRDDLLGFTKFTFPKYDISGHHLKIASALEAVERGEIKRLNISAPHQRGKTELGIVRFVPWILGKHPDWPIIIISYGDVPVERFSRRALDVIRTDQYKRLFPEFQLSKRSQSVSTWEIEGNRGGVRAASIGGAVNSFPCQGLIIDDAFKGFEEAASPTIRDKVWEFYLSIAYSRLAPDGWIINTGTRQNEDDLTGRLDALEKNGGDKWHKVRISAIDDSEQDADRLVELYKEYGEDWINDRYGHLVTCWPERWKLSKYLDARINIGRQLFETQYMGRPYSPEGGILKRSWFVISPRHPMGLKWYRCWDIATTSKKSGSCTAGARLAVDNEKNLWIADIIRGQWEWPEARRRIINTAAIDGPDVEVLIEKGAYQFGKLAEDLVDNWEDIRFTVRAVSVRGMGDKEARVRPWAARAEAGKVILVGAHDTPWITDFLELAPAFREEALVTDPFDAISLGYGVIASQGLGKKYEPEQHKPLSPAWTAQRVQEQAARGESIFPDVGGYVFDPE